MKYEIKFEWIFAAIVTLILTAYLFFGSPSEDLATAIIMAFVGVVTGITGFIYGKSRPDQ